MFPLGTFVLIREPTYLAGPNDGFLLRVDAPADISLIPPNSPLVSNAKWASSAPRQPGPLGFDYKALGNRYFSFKTRGKDLLALKAYTTGLALATSDQERLVLFLNRSQVNIRLGYFVAGYRDAASALDLLKRGTDGPPRAEYKATFRRAHALEGMRIFSLARDEYDVLLRIDPSSPEGFEGVKRIERVLRESKTGEYDWKALENHEEADESGMPAVGAFVGPIKVAQLEGRGGGRGVVATQDIEPGEVLLGKSPSSHLCRVLRNSRPSCLQSSRLSSLSKQKSTPTSSASM